MHEQPVVAPQFLSQLADRFEERQRFNVADRATDLDDDDVDIVPHLAHASLDFIGHMRDHLHGFAQVIPSAFAQNDLFVDAAGGEVVGTRQRGVSEAFVVAKVEVGLGAIIGYEDFAVLIRTHRARVDIQVWIEFLQINAQSAAFEQAADAGRGDSLAQR